MLTCLRLRTGNGLFSVRGISEVQFLSYALSSNYVKPMLPESFYPTLARIAHTLQLAIHVVTIAEMNSGQHRDWIDMNRPPKVSLHSLFQGLHMDMTCPASMPQLRCCRGSHQIHMHTQKHVRVDDFNYNFKIQVERKVAAFDSKKWLKRLQRI